MKFLLASILLTFVLGFGYLNDSDYTFEYPDYFPIPNYEFDSNPLDSQVIRLGKALFYDPILSTDNTISCSSCHSPFNSFAHTDHDLSHGIGDSIGHRNAPALINLAWNEHFMWDGAIRNLDMQALAPIEHPREMGSSFAEAIQRLGDSNLYRGLFFNAFQDSLVTGQKTLQALSQFQLTLVSDQSKYDEVRRNENTFTKQEQNGYTLFLKHCNSCHTEPLFTNHRFERNALPMDPSLMDYGRMGVTKLRKDSAHFKVPSLRNLAFTYPYMHDGRFKKLSEVINHYAGLHDTGVKKENNPLETIELSSNEKVDLISFLLTLSDKKFVFNPAHRFPRDIFFPND